MPDDQTIVEGDAGFLGMASRLNPLQLQPGMVQYCENMRLDRGVAQTRKGAKRLAESIGNIGEAVTVPFQLGPDKTISSLTRGGTGNLTATATLTAHGYATGDRINIRGASPSQFNGDFFITVTNANTFTYTLPSDPGANATGTLLANKGPVIQSTYTGGIISAGIYSSPRLDNSNEYVVLAGPNAAYFWRNGANLLTKSYPSTDTLVAGDDVTILQAFDKLYILRDRPESKIRVTSISQTGGTLNALRDTWLFSTTSMIAVGDAGTILNYNGKIWAAQVTDTNENLNSIWAANATNAWAVGNAGTILKYDGTNWSPQTSDTTENLLAVWGTTSSHLIAVGANGTILLYNGTSWSPQTSGTTQDLRGVWGTASNNVYAVGDNGTILRWNGTAWSALTSNITDTLNDIWGTGSTNIYAVGAAGRILRSTNGTAWSALTSGVSDTLNSVWGSGTTNIFAAGNGGRLLRSTNGTTWTTLTSNTTSDLFEVGGSSANNMAAVGSAGTIILSTNSTTWTPVVRGIATATTSAAHGYSVNQAVRITGVTDPADLPEGVTTSEAYNGEFIISSVPTSTTFTYTVPGTTFAIAAGTMFAQRIQPSLVWDGDPATNFVRVNIGTLAELGQLSFIGMPSTAIATYFNNQVVVARGRDEILVSDVLDGETYDSALKTFRANAGSNDFIVAIHPFAEHQLLIFCRHSIYLARVVFDTTGFLDLSNSSLTLLTDEIGCSARRSVVTAGTAVFFLSDNGVYRLDNQLDLKLRGNTQPLSDPIADLLAVVNTNAVKNSTGAYFNNRYYLAVPLGASTACNALFAYNMLNQQWETKDIYGFSLDRLLVTDYGTQRRLYAATLNGRLFLLDEQDSGEDDTLSGLGTTTVEGMLLTRRYGWGSLNAKRLTRSKASIVLPAGATCVLDAVTTDFDSDFQIATLTNATNQEEDYTLKAPLRRKATALDLRYRTTAGRPILRQISAEAVRSNFDPTETRTLN